MYNKHSFKTENAIFPLTMYKREGLQFISLYKHVTIQNLSMNSISFKYCSNYLLVLI